MKLRNILFILIIGSCLLSACGTQNAKERVSKNLTEEQLYTRGEVALARREYRSAINMFEALEARYPFSKYTRQSQLDIIYAYYKTGDKALAAAAAERFIRLYPRDPKVDYAYYIKGVANYEQEHGLLQRYLPVDMAERDPGTAQQAYTDFQRLIESYPNSPYAADARKRLLYLRNMLARRELRLAQFYYRKQAYVAAANRAGNVMKYYSHSPYVAKALVILVHANRALGLKQPTADAERLLQLNFPTVAAKHSAAEQHKVSRKSSK